MQYYASLDLTASENYKKRIVRRLRFIVIVVFFEFNVMPFGLVNAPSIAIHLIAIALEGLDKFTVAYFDDIVKYLETLVDHLRHIRQVFEKLQQHDLKLKLKKCSFLKEETKY